jgi:hypothetical protein
VDPCVFRFSNLFLFGSYDHRFRGVPNSVSVNELGKRTELGFLFLGLLGCEIGFDTFMSDQVKFHSEIIQFHETPGLSSYQCSVIMRGRAEIRVIPRQRIEIRYRGSGRAEGTAQNTYDYRPG